MDSLLKTDRHCIMNDCTIHRKLETSNIPNYKNNQGASIKHSLTTRHKQF